MVKNIILKYSMKLLGVIHPTSCHHLYVILNPLLYLPCGQTQQKLVLILNWIFFFQFCNNISYHIEHFFSDYELRNKTVPKELEGTGSQIVKLLEDRYFSMALPENRTFDKYKQDIALVHIYFESPNVVEYKKEQTMTM